MKLAYTGQAFQDWCTQQWVMLRGREIDPAACSWLMGPFGNLDGIGAGFIHQLAEREHLVVARNHTSCGLIPSIEALELPAAQRSLLSPAVIRFYEHTAGYNFDFSVKWNPLFRIFGLMVNRLFSSRIDQLHIPMNDMKEGEALESELITLSEPASGHVKYTLWLRTLRSSGRVIYSGVYGTCRLPSGQVCIKAVFPLPMGNATVIMAPDVSASGELILNASGKRFGDPGFYFLLHDAQGRYWSRFVGSFRDRLIVNEAHGLIAATQTLTLWHRNVLTFAYKIRAKT